MTGSVEALTERIAAESATLQQVIEELHTVVVGQEPMLTRLLIGLLADGHVLLEGVPGLAKTTAVRALAAVVQCDFRRVQFTPDLLPADLIGTQVFRPQDGTFETRLGPIFGNIVLADEINRAPAKVQSALLEAMQERQVTIGGETHPLPQPFLVLATQNPIEQEGTYPLPEAQVDRFFLKVLLDYPTKEEELLIMDRALELKPDACRPVLTPDMLTRLRGLVHEVFVDPKVKDYIVNLVFSTREPAAHRVPITGQLTYGASPRASIYLLHAARAHAMLQGRGYVTPQDVKTIAPDVLRHRLVLSYEAEAEELTPDDVVATILSHVEVP